MALLKRTLYTLGGLLLVGGIALSLAPGWVTGKLLGQPAYPDVAWIRLSGIDSATVALLAILVAHHIETHWWWSWAFALGAAASGAVTTFHALVGLPESAAAWPWWAMAAIGWGFALTLVWGLARAGQEKPIV
ncbi:MAG TPA: hypothetical protein VEA19_03235 [Actinomycetota bacterium]|nr:hypothetical protein [Actinomycetota bacterium]